MSCGPISILNLEIYFLGRAQHHIETLREMCHTRHTIGSPKIWFARTLCDVAGQFNWTVNATAFCTIGGCSPKTAAILWVKESPRWPYGHYFLISSNHNGYFSCINFERDEPIESYVSAKEIRSIKLRNCWYIRK